MRVKNESVEFFESDMHFVNKVGLMEAVEMVLDYKSVNRVPFIYDTYQLSDILLTGRARLFSLIRNCDQNYKQINIKKSN